MPENRNAPGKGPTHNVIAMSLHRTETRFPHIATVEAYWHALRGTRAVPRRSEVDPRGIEGSLEYTFILEQVAPGVGRLRIAGSHLSDLLGMEVRGMPLTAFFAPDARADLSACVEKVCADPTVAMLSLQAEPGIGKPVLEARLVLLPMTNEGGEVNRILGCLDTNGSIGRAPRRFTIMSRRLTQITGQDVARAWNKPPTSATRLDPLRGFAEKPATFHGASARQPQGRPAPHLRVVTSQT